VLFLHCCEKLALFGVEFAVHYVGGKDDTPQPIITVKSQLNNEQLRVLTELGANMGPDSSFMIITSMNIEDTIKS